MEKSSGGGGGTALINLSFCSTNMLCSDWGQSDRRTKPSPPPHLPRTPSPPPSLTQHIHFYHVAGLSFFFFFPCRFLGENICTRGPTNWCNSALLHLHHLRWSSGRSPRRSFNCNTFQMARVPLSFVARKPVFVSHSTLGATQTGRKQRGKQFHKMVSGISGHLLRRYMTCKT